MNSTHDPDYKTVDEIFAEKVTDDMTTSERLKAYDEAAIEEGRQLDDIEPIMTRVIEQNGNHIKELGGYDNDVYIELDKFTMLTRDMLDELENDHICFKSINIEKSIINFYLD